MNSIQVYHRLHDTSRLHHEQFHCFFFPLSLTRQLSLGHVDIGLLWLLMWKPIKKVLFSTKHWSIPGEGEVIVIYYRCGTGPGARLTSEQLVMFRSCFPPSLFLSLPPFPPFLLPFLPFLLLCVREASDGLTAELGLCHSLSMIWGASRLSSPDWIWCQTSLIEPPEQRKQAVPQRKLNCNLHTNRAAEPGLRRSHVTWLLD